jgi:hypothetical protein
VIELPFSQQDLAEMAGKTLYNVRRAQLRAELDAYYARLYGLTRDELRYTPIGVDPKEVYGEDFPGETFRVLKEKVFVNKLSDTVRLISAVQVNSSLIKNLRVMVYLLF